MGFRFSWMVLALWLAAGCAALSDDMRRAETAFDEARYEDVEVWLQALEPDVADMDVEMRARYYYLRGTTAFRLHDRTDARHYLALAREESAQDPAMFKPQWRRELERMLQELKQPEGGSGAEDAG